MPTTPIHIGTARQDAAAKSRPVSLPWLDLHALGIHRVDGEPVPRMVVVPPAEPGSVFEVVIITGYAALVAVDPEAPGLLPRPWVMICDSAGADGELAVAVLVRGEGDESVL